MAKTSKPLVVEQNVETGEIIEREMNAAEYERYLADKTNTEANLAAIANKEAARQAILDRLGLTADEAKLLLG
jgi:uncharacterized protein YfcZ (UPF0381/DUF406 family)